MTLTVEELKERRRVATLPAQEKQERRLAQRRVKDNTVKEKRKQDTALREIEESIALVDYLVYLEVDMSKMEYFTARFVREAWGWKHANFLS